MLNRTPKRLATVAVSLSVACAITGATGAAALAQDATPIGPEAASCVAPELTASPVAATPSGETSAATPVNTETELPEGTVVDNEAVIAQATATIENLYACYNTGDGAKVVALFTPSGLNAAYGAGDPMTIAAQVSALAGAAQANELDINGVVAYEDGRLSVDYHVVIGKRLFHFVDVLVEEDGIWKIDDRREQMPETELDSTTGGIKTSEEGGVLTFEISPNPLSNQEAVKFQVVNEGENTHHIHLFKTPEGFDGSTLIDADLTNLPDGVTFLGTESVLPGDHDVILFEHLEDGTYTVVGYAIDPTGQRVGEASTTELTIDPPFDPTA